MQMVLHIKKYKGWYKNMSGKNEKKLRQLVRRNQTSLVNQSWDCFFQTISEMKFKYRFQLAWKILKGSNIREEEQKKIRK